VDQILAVGEVIITDHFAYENKSCGMDSLRSFVGNIRSMVDLQSRGRIKLDVKYARIDGVLMVHFTKTSK
jgi:hypothetical protein